MDVSKLKFPNVADPKKHVFSLEEIKKNHSTRESCYLVANGRVHDVTLWLDHHPAGAQCILNRAAQGGDASRDLNFHSPGARELWKKYEIGVVEGHESSCVIS